jgi:hypothetical protein
MPWGPALVLTIGGLLVLGGVIAFIAALIKNEKARRREERRMLGISNLKNYSKKRIS